MTKHPGLRRRTERQRITQAKDSGLLYRYCEHKWRLRILIIQTQLGAKL